MAAIERYLARLKVLQSEVSTDALAPKENDQTAFGFGKACGVYRGLRLAEELLETVLNEQDADDEPNSRRRKS